MIREKAAGPQHGFICKTARQIIRQSYLMISAAGVIWSSRSSRFAGGITYTQWRQEGLWNAHGSFQLEALLHFSTCTLRTNGKENKIYHFRSIFQFRSCDDHAPREKKTWFHHLIHPSLRVTA